MLIKAFPEDFARRLTSRMETKFVEHVPSKPYPLKDLCDGALWVAEGLTAGEGGGTAQIMGARAEETVKVKTEGEQMMAFADVIKRLTEAVQNMGGPQYAGQAYSSGVPPLRGGYRGGFIGGVTRGGAPGPSRGGGMYSGGYGPLSCNFCDAPGHFIRECPRVEEYIAAGKCIRGEGGRLVLPTGFMLPNWAVGKCLMERFDRFAAEMAKFSAPEEPTVSQSLYEVRDRKSTRLNSSHSGESRMPSSA